MSDSKMTGPVSESSEKPCRSHVSHDYGMMPIIFQNVFLNDFAGAEMNLQIQRLLWNKPGMLCVSILWLTSRAQ
jgi:hypothetical protein